MVFQKMVWLNTNTKSMIDITSSIEVIIQQSNIQKGICVVFIHHTSASLLVTENADPEVQNDLLVYFEELVQDGDPIFRHRAEGPDDMSAHIRSVLTQTSLSIPIRDYKADLGTWQGIYLFEHRSFPHKRRISVTIMGE